MQRVVKRIAQVFLSEKPAEDILAYDPYSLDSSAEKRILIIIRLTFAVTDPGPDMSKSI